MKRINIFTFFFDSFRFLLFMNEYNVDFGVAHTKGFFSLLFNTQVHIQTKEKKQRRKNCLNPSKKSKQAHIIYAL